MHKISKFNGVYNYTPFLSTLNRTNVLIGVDTITHLEDFIAELYGIMRIRTPQQLNINRIAHNLRINVHYGCANFVMGNDIIIKRSTKEREWQTFGHELGHYLRHCGNQCVMPYLFHDLQEYQANHFAYHFCVPTFMLNRVQPLTVQDVVDLFCVEYQFAWHRLDMYQFSKGEELL